MKYMTKKEIEKRMVELKKSAEAQPDQSGYNAAYEYGYSSALKDVLDSWFDLYYASRFESAVEDAKNHLRDYIKDDAEYASVEASNIPQLIASRFLNHYDCDQAENDQYEAIIEDILEKNKGDV